MDNPHSGKKRHSRKPLYITLVVVGLIVLIATCGDEESPTISDAGIGQRSVLSTHIPDVPLPEYGFGRKTVNHNQYEIKAYLKSKPTDSTHLSLLALNIVEVTKDEHELPQVVVSIYASEHIASSERVNTGFVYSYFRNAQAGAETKQFNKEQFEYITGVSNDNTQYHKNNVDHLNTKLKRHGISACELVTMYSDISHQSYREADKMYQVGTKNNFDYQEKYLKQERDKLSAKYGLTNKDWDAYFWSEDFMCDVVFK